MLSIIGGFVVFTLLIYVGTSVYSSFIMKRITKNPTESDLISKFNKVVKKITNRNLDTVKDELLEILEEYKRVKCADFIESKTLLTKSKTSLTSQILEIGKQKRNLNQSILDIKDKIQAGTVTKEEEEVGIIYVSDYEALVDIENKLNQSLEIIEEKLRSIETSIKLFNHKYSMKVSEITLMIASAVSIKNVSGIDIKLNDLVTEFKTKVQEKEIEVDVKEKIYGKTIGLGDKDIKEIDKSSCLEKLKNW